MTNFIIENNILLFDRLNPLKNITRQVEDVNSEENIFGVEETETSCEQTNDSEMTLIAHRGYSEIAPENTIPAFIAAAENGFNAVECDIEWTKDGVPVILHDEKINKTARNADGSKIFFPKKCSKLTFEQLQQYDFGIWKGEEFKGTKIPSFEDLLNCCKDYDLNLYVELKDNSKFDEDKARLLVDYVKEAGLEDKITWISFNSSYLEMMSSLMPEARLGYLVKDYPNDKTMQVLESLKNSDNEVFLDIKLSKISEDYITMLQEEGFDFEAWTVNNEEELDNLNKLNCSGITTDSINK